MVTPSVTCYPQPGKARSYELLSAFAKGALGRVCAQRFSLEAGPAAFYGLMSLEELFKRARTDGRDWYYGDNAFFDVARHRFFRFSKNCFQSIASGASADHARLQTLGLKIEPWRRSGKNILIIEQSEHFMKSVGRPIGWAQQMHHDVRMFSDRPVVLRFWDRNKARASQSLRAELQDAWALVTYSSAAANEALLAGVPVCVSDDSVALPFSTELSKIESPSMLDGREDWAARLAASQWTIDEIKSGNAWRMLNG